MKKYLLLFMMLIAIFTINSCEEDDTEGGVTVSGLVVNESGQPINGVQVAIGSATATTDAQGSYSISGISEAAISVSAEATGYFKAYRNGENRDGSAVKIDLMMITKSDLGTLNADAGGSVTDGDITVTASPSGFTNADGTAYSGSVRVSGRVIKDNDANIGSLMPGGDYAATNNSGEEGMLQTFGFTATEFTDPSGNTLTPVSGQVTVSFTASSTPQDAQLWVFNPVSGTWSYGGELTVAGNNVMMPVTGGTYHNCDAFRTTTAIIEGIVTDCDGNPIVTAVKLDNGYARYTTATNGNGRFRAEVVMLVGGPDYSVNAAGVSVIATNTSAQTVNLTIEVDPETGQLCVDEVQGQFVAIGSNAPIQYPDGAICAIDNEDNSFILRVEETLSVMVIFPSEPVPGSYNVGNTPGSSAYISILAYDQGTQWIGQAGGQIVVSIVGGKKSVAFSNIPVLSDTQVASTASGNLTCGN